MIYYLGYYACGQTNAEIRVAAPPAINKMGYVIYVLSEIPDVRTVVVSPSGTGLHRYVRGSEHKLYDRVSLKTFDSFSSKNKVIRGLGYIWTRAHLLHFLMTNVNTDDTVVVYHSLSLMNVVRKLKKKINCRLIIEVEELYSDVKEDKYLREKEIEYLQLADRYIFISDLLNKQVNLQDKPRIISHGTYRTVPDCSSKFGDGKVHVVYAGTFNPIKGGALTAISVAEYLDENYVLHILGKGSENDTKSVLDKIKEISMKTGCRIAFDGFKSGRDFDSFIQSCHIGLSTQQPNGKYNASSFPSKILMYMSNGLPVVSIRIPAVETSNVGDYIYYYDTNDPQNIAQAIKSVPVDRNLGVREKLNELDVIFKKELDIFLK